MNDITKPLHQTVALITGASSGMGRSTAIRLAAMGASVVIVARPGERLETVADELRAMNGSVLAVPADLADPVAGERVVAAAIEAFGRLDIVVNAAGVMLNGPSLDASLDQWNAMIDVNLRGLLSVTRAALPHLVQAVAGGDRQVADVVNISSVAGRAAGSGAAVYSATKFAVTGATEAFRQEFTRKSVRFSVVEPGATETGLWDVPGQREGFEAMFGKIEHLTADDIADTVAFIVTCPRRVAINEVVVRPTDQV